MSVDRGREKARGQEKRRGAEKRKSGRGGVGWSGEREKHFCNYFLLLSNGNVWKVVYVRFFPPNQCEEIVRVLKECETEK